MKRASLVAFFFAVFVCGGALAGVIFAPQSAGLDMGMPASYNTAAYGAALEEEANEDPNTVMYCAVDHADGVTSKPQCALSGVRHTGVGPFTGSNNFFLGTGDDVLDFTGDFSLSLVIDPVTVAATRTIFADAEGGGPGGSAGYTVGYDATGAVIFATWGAAASSTVTTSAAGALVVGQKALISFGREGTTQRLQVNGVETTTANAKLVPATSDPARIGYSAGTDVKIYEITASPLPATSARLTVAWTAASTCRVAGHCLPHDTGEVIHLLGDEYLIGSLWCGAHLAPGATCPAAQNFDLNGFVPTAKSRYNWPALAWAMVGTVPRANASALYPRGYGVRHASVGPFTNANYIRHGTFTGGTLAGCVKVSRTGSSADDIGSAPAEVIFSNVDGAGFWVTSRVGQPFVFHWFDVGGTERTVTSTILDHLYAVDDVCFGYDGTMGWISVNGETPVTDTQTFDSSAGTIALLLGNGGTNPYAGKIYELVLTSTAVTASWLTMQSLAGASCSQPGPCYLLDAGTKLHCVADDYTGGVLRCRVNVPGDAFITEGTVARNAGEIYVNADNERRDAAGVGPFSAANHFKLGAGADVLDFTGDFTCSLTLTPDNFAVFGQPFDDGVQNEGGWFVQIAQTSGAFYWRFAKAGVTTLLNAGSVTAGAPNILLMGRAGNTAWAKVNNAAAVSGAAGDIVPGTVRPAYIGVEGGGGGGDAFAGVISEIWCSTTPASDANFTRIQRRFLNHRGERDQAVTVTRTADGTTTHSAGRVWRAAANTIRQEDTRVEWSVSVDTAPTATHQITPPGKIIGSAYSNEAYSGAGGGLDTTRITPTGVTVTENGALAPDGTMTATALREDVSNGSHSIQYLGDRTGIAADVHSVYIRPVGRLGVYGQLYGVDGVSYYSQITHSGGAATQERFATYSSGAAPENVMLRGHEHLADGWIRVWWVGGLTGSKSLIMGIYGPTSSSYAGDITKGMDVWGYQHQIANLTTAMPYCGIPSAAAVTCNADVVTVANPLRPNGTDWTNVALQSEAFDSASWVAQGVVKAAPTVTANNALAPDQSFTAEKVAISATDGGNQISRLYQGWIATAANYTFSVYLKADSGTPTVNVALSDGSASHTFTACVLNSSTYTRCSVTKLLSAATWYATIGANTYAYSGEPTVQAGATIYVSDAQVELGTTPSPYCPTTTTARTCGPGGATGKVRTNWLAQSDNFSGATWTKTAGGGAVVPVIAASVEVCPLNNGVTASKIDFPATTAAQFSVMSQGPGSASGGSYVVWVKSVAATDTYHLAYTHDGVTGASTCAVNSTTWTPCYAGNAGGSAKYAQNGPFQIAAGTNAASFHICHAEAELIPGAGPYCGPTGAAAKTCAPKQRWCVRVKDATPLNGGPWSVVTRTLASSGTLLGPNSWWLYYYTNGEVRWELYNAAGVSNYILAPANFAAGSTHTITACVNDGVPAVYLDGVAPASTVAGSGILAQWNTGVYWGATTSAVTYWFDGTIGSLQFNTTGNPKDFPND
jgi:hypothetical protein